MGRRRRGERTEREWEVEVLKKKSLCPSPSDETVSVGPHIG